MTWLKPRRSTPLILITLPTWHVYTGLWSSFTPDPQTAETLGETSSDYFSKAVVLSPQNARLWDEWAVLYLNVFQDLDEVFDRLTQSLELDPYYDWTHALLGDYYTRLAQATDDPASEEQALQKAAEHYTQAFELAAKNDLHAKYNYLLVLANTHIQLNQPQLAIQAYEQALELGINQQDNWRIEETIGRIFAQMGDVEKLSSGSPEHSCQHLRRRKRGCNRWSPSWKHKGNIAQSSSAEQ